MANSTINAQTTGLTHTGGDANVLDIKTNSTTAISINASQVVSLTNALPVTSGGTGATTASAALANLGGVSPGKAIALSMIFGF